VCFAFVQCLVKTERMTYALKFITELVEASFSDVRRNSDHHSNGFRGLLSTFMRISKYLLKRTQIVSFLQMLERMMQPFRM
jgi:hypothetical protein